MSYHPEFARQQEVPDPYYGGLRGFELVLQMIEVACNELLHRLKTGR